MGKRVTENAFHIKDSFAKGDKINSVDHKWLNTVARVLNHIKGQGCRIIKDRTGNGWVISVPSSSSGSSSVSFSCSITDATHVTYQKGWCYYSRSAGQLFASAAIECKDGSEVPATGYIYVKLDYQTGVFDAPAFQESDPVAEYQSETVGVWILCETTAVENSDGVYELSSVLQRWQGDIHETRA